MLHLHVYVRRPVYHAVWAFVLLLVHSSAPGCRRAAGGPACPAGESGPEGRSGGEPSSLCPQCSSPLRQDHLNPSFALKAVVKHVSQERQHASQEQGPYLSLKNFLGSNKDYLSSKELEQLRAQIQEYKQEAERKEKAGR